MNSRPGAIRLGADAGIALSSLGERESGTEDSQRHAQQLHWLRISIGRSGWMTTLGLKFV
jgi:hypothetical protein